MSMQEALILQRSILQQSDNGGHRFQLVMLTSWSIFHTRKKRNHFNGGAPLVLAHVHLRGRTLKTEFFVWK